MAKETVSKAFTGQERSVLRSWIWVREDAAEILDALRAGPPGADSGHELLWKTKTKYVLRMKTASGLDLACKWYARIRQAPYAFSWTHAAKEAYNFRRLADLGLPLVKLVAAGEARYPLYIRNAFIVTEFADGFLDGRYFFETPDREGALLDEFIRRNFALVVRLHDAGICHGSFNPMNELWRKLPEPDAEGHRMELRWIDIATCHPASGDRLKRCIVEDFVNFLRFYPFVGVEGRRAYLHGYLDAAKVRRFDPDALHRAVEDALAARARRKLAEAEKKKKKMERGA